MALEITADLPEKNILKRWLGEPIRCVILPTSVFATNKKGYPVLSKPHQSFVKDLMRMHIQFLITGQKRHGDVKLYQQYLDYLTKVRNFFLVIVIHLLNL